LGQMDLALSPGSERADDLETASDTGRCGIEQHAAYIGPTGLQLDAGEIEKTGGWTVPAAWLTS